eukprot:SAG31_NODE_591_length_13740_cov_11.032256_7_plen_121_part_00
MLREDEETGRLVAETGRSSYEDDRIRDSVVGQVTGSAQPAAKGERYWLWMGPDTAGEADPEKRKQTARGCTVLPGPLGGPREVRCFCFVFYYILFCCRCPGLQLGVPTSVRPPILLVSLF